MKLQNVVYNIKQLLFNYIYYFIIIIECKAPCLLTFISIAYILYSIFVVHPPTQVAYQRVRIRENIPKRLRYFSQTVKIHFTKVRKRYPTQEGIEHDTIKSSKKFGTAQGILPARMVKNMTKSQNIV